MTSLQAGDTAETPVLRIALDLPLAASPVESGSESMDVPVRDVAALDTGPPRAVPLRC